MKRKKVKKVVFRGFYNLNGQYLLFEDNPLHGATFYDVAVETKKEKVGVGKDTYYIDVIYIEGQEPIECELVCIHKEDDGTLIISICQDWG